MAMLVLHRIIIWTNVDLLIRPYDQNLVKSSQDTYIVFQGKAFENIVCKMVDIL